MFRSNIPEEEKRISIAYYEAASEFQLSFGEGEIITVLDKFPNQPEYNGWYQGKIDEFVGLFPVNHTEPYTFKEIHVDTKHISSMIENLAKQCGFIDNATGPDTVRGLHEEFEALQKTISIRNVKVNDLPEKMVKESPAKDENTTNSDVGASTSKSPTVESGGGNNIAVVSENDGKVSINETKEDTHSDELRILREKVNNLEAENLSLKKEVENMKSNSNEKNDSVYESSESEHLKLVEQHDEDVKKIVQLEAKVEKLKHKKHGSHHDSKKKKSEKETTPRHGNKKRDSPVKKKINHENAESVRDSKSKVQAPPPPPPESSQQVAQLKQQLGQANFKIEKLMLMLEDARKNQDALVEEVEVAQQKSIKPSGSGIASFFGFPGKPPKLSQSQQQKRSSHQTHEIKELESQLASYIEVVEKMVADRQTLVNMNRQLIVQLREAVKETI